MLPTETTIKQAIMDYGFEIDSLKDILCKHATDVKKYFEDGTESPFDLRLHFKCDATMITTFTLVLNNDYGDSISTNPSRYLILDLPYLNAPDIVYKKTNYSAYECDNYLRSETYTFQPIESLLEVQEIVEQKKIALQNAINIAQEQLDKLQENKPCWIE